MFARPDHAAAIRHRRADTAQRHRAVEHHFRAQGMLGIEVQEANHAVGPLQRRPQPALEPDRRGGRRRIAEMFDPVAQRRKIGRDAGQAVAAGHVQAAVPAGGQFGPPGRLAQQAFGQQAALRGFQRQPVLRTGQPAVQGTLARVQRQQGRAGGAEAGREKRMLAGRRRGHRGVGIGIGQGIGRRVARRAARQLDRHGRLTQAGGAGHGAAVERARAKRRQPGAGLAGGSRRLQGGARKRAEMKFGRKLHPGVTGQARRAHQLADIVAGQPRRHRLACGTTFKLHS